MAEIGIDLKNQQPQLLLDSMVENSHKTVNMGCMDEESCPSLFVKDVDDWNVDDPKGKSIDDVRKIRDQIKHGVLNLLNSLELLLKLLFDTPTYIVAELIGTFILVFAGTGAIIINDIANVY